jgi:hypothetical protein
MCHVCVETGLFIEKNSEEEHGFWFENWGGGQHGMVARRAAAKGHLDFGGFSKSVSEDGSVGLLG